jgi:hypothetical protein
VVPPLPHHPPATVEADDKKETDRG